MAQATETSNEIFEVNLVPHRDVGLPSYVSTGEISAPSDVDDPKDLIHVPLNIAAGLHMALRAKHLTAASHSLRVAMWTTAWGFTYGLRDDHLQLFEFSGLLHEIGKIGIPDRVLQKADGLNDHEQAMMDLHPQVGVEILRAAGVSKTLLKCVVNVGMDYSTLPDPDTNDSASMSARLIRIVDAYDSMTSWSAYRDPLSRKDAIAELIRNAGSQFDPKLARSFAQMVLRPQRKLEERVQKRWGKLLPMQAEQTPFEFDQVAARCGPAAGGPLMHSLSDSFYRHMLNHIQQAVIFVDNEFRILQWNREAERMTGQAADAVLHHFWKPSLVGFCDRSGFPIPDHQCPFLSMIISGERSQRKLSIKRLDGKILDAELEVVPVINDRGKLTGGAVIMNDVSEQTALEQKLIHLNERASQDQLTKIANRGELNRQLPAFIETHSGDDIEGAIIICDIDYFKRINDNFSHQAGDEALKAFATLLRDSCRTTDLVARYGGEEFVMLCPQCDLEEARQLAESLRSKLQRTPMPALRGACITASFGVTVVKSGDTDESAIGRADRGLITAKQNGRDRVICMPVEPTNTASPTTGIQANTWMDWVELANNKSKLEAELITDVPKSIACEKLKGFVQEFKAAVTNLDADYAIFEIDCRNTPMPRRANERLGKYRVHVALQDIELKAGPDKTQIRQAALVKVIMTPIYARDRREDASAAQSARLMQALQCYLLAQAFDESLKADLIRVIKPETDSRYG